MKRDVLTDGKKQKRSHRKAVGLIIAISIILSSGVIAPFQSAIAATIKPTQTQTLDPPSQAKSFAYYKALRTCFAVASYKNSIKGVPLVPGDATFSQADALNFEWFNSNKWVVIIISTAPNGINVGVINDPRNTKGSDAGDGQQNCGGDEGKIWVEEALKLWGYSSGTVADFLCNQLGFTRQSGDKANCTDTTANVDNDFIPPSDVVSKLDTFWTTGLGNASVNPSSIRPLGGEYILNLASFQSQCRPAKGGGSVYQTLEFNNGDATATPVITSYGAPDKTRTPDGFRPTIYDQTQKSCQELADTIKDIGYLNDVKNRKANPTVTNKVVLGYMKFLKSNNGNQTGTGTANNCVAGSTNPACAVTSSCAIENGFGWMICPIMDTLATLHGALFAWVQSVMVLNPLSSQDANGNVTPQYQNWSNIRNIANVLLVIAFLIVIFSQISSVGISNYGIKKMMPRVILIAIAINVSWLIMSLSFDVVNIVGIGLNSLLDATTVNPTTDSVVENNLWANFIGGDSNLISALIAGGGTAVAVGGASVIAGPILGLSLGTLALLALPFLLGAALALLAAVVTLFLRNAIIIVLVIIAPVAIVAYLLPNTEEWFKKWRKMFIQMLLLFPLAALLFAGAKFASYILLTSNQPFNIITGMFVMAAPLGALPWLARSSGGIMAAVGGRLQSAAKYGRTSLQKGLQPRVDAQKAEYRSGQRNFLGVKRSEKRQYDPINGKGRMTGAQMWSNKGIALKAREDNAGKLQNATWKESGLRAPGTGSKLQQRQAKYVSSIVDTGKVQDLRGEAADASYKGRLEASKLTPGKTRDIYDRLKDAQTSTESLEHEQKLRQTDRIKSNAINTAASGIGLSRLSKISADDGGNITEGQATRLQKLAQNSIDGDGGTGLKVLHENQETAEFANKNLEDAMHAEFEQSKLPGGANADLFADSIVGKADSDRIAAEQKRVETEARIGVNQQNPDGTKFFTQETLKDDDGNEIKDDKGNPILAGGQLGAVRDLDQDTQASSAATAWAEGGKGILYAKEIRSGSERGKELAVAASGADVKDLDGKQEIDETTGEPKIAILTQAKAAKAVLEDELSDETTIVSLAKSTSMKNEEALDKLGVDYYGNFESKDGTGIGVAKLSDTPTEERGYIRYAAGRQDRGTSMALLSYLGERGKLASAASKRIAAAKAAGSEPDSKDVKLVDNVKKAQSAFQETVGTSLPPWIGGSDQQKIAEGRFEFNNEEAAISAVASGKMTADAFSAMDINNRVAFVKALQETPKKYPEQYQFAINSSAAKLAEEHDPNYPNLSEKEQADAREAMMPIIKQNFAQTIIPIDKAQFDVRLNRNLAARDREQYESMRQSLRDLSGGLPPNIETGQVDPRTSAPVVKKYTGYMDRPIVVPDDTDS